MTSLEPDAGYEQRLSSDVAGSVDAMLGRNPEAVSLAALFGALPGYWPPDVLRVLDDLGIEHASLRTMVRSLKRAGGGATGTRWRLHVSRTPPAAAMSPCVCTT